MKIFNKIKRNTWDLVFDSSRNPLNRLPVPVRYQLMIVLATTWSLIFCVMVQLHDLIPYWILAHIGLITAGCVVTNHTFDNYKPTHRDMYKSQDGTYALFDDYWGS